MCQRYTEERFYVPTLRGGTVERYTEHAGRTYI